MKKGIPGMLVVLFSLFMACTGVFAASATGGHEKAVYARIEALMLHGQFEAARDLTFKLESYVKDSGRSENDFPEWMGRTLDIRAQAEGKLGRYVDAANTQRESNSYLPKPENIDKVMDFSKKDGVQGEYFSAKMNFITGMYARKKEILGLSMEKENLVKGFMRNKEIKKEDLERLQASFKKLDETIQAKNREIEGLHKEFQPNLDAFAKQDIAFNKDQNMSITQRGQELSRVDEEAYRAQKMAQGGLMQIVEKFKWGWNGLEEKLTKMQGVQNQIMGFQQKMLGLMSKKPLSDADKKALQDLKAQVDKLMGEQAALMADIEKAFMDTKVFSQLTPEQQKKYFEIFKVLHDARKVIAANFQKIIAFIKEMIFVYGDIDGSGKVDGGDLNRLASYLSNIYRPFPFKMIAFGCIPPNFRTADVDGDGRLTWADYTLMKEAVGGNRKTFPADPNNKPGDMDGDGVLSQSDANSLIKAIFDPGSFGGGWKHVADLNGDGKIDIGDVMVLINKIQEENPIPVNVATATTQIGTATAFIGTETVNVATATIVATGSGDATGEVQVATGTSTDFGQAATGIDSAY